MVMKGLMLMRHLTALMVGASLSLSAGAASRIRHYTKSEIAAAITLPATPEQLLQNLKAAWSHDLLVEPSFYDDPNLLKFFNATKVAWEQESNPGKAPDFGNGRVTINTLVFPKMTVELIRGTHIDNGRAAALSGFMKIDVEAIPGITVGLVREVFGEESEDKLDFGIDTDAHGHAPTTAGSLLYEKYDKEIKTAPYQEYWASFVVKKTKPGLPTQGYKFLANEQVKEIVLFQAEK